MPYHRRHGTVPGGEVYSPTDPYQRQRQRCNPPPSRPTTAGVGAFTSNRVNYHHHGVVTVVVAVAAAAVIALQRQRPSRGRPRFESYQLPARVFSPAQFVTTAGVGAFTSNCVNYHHHGVVTVVVAVAVVAAVAGMAQCPVAVYFTRFDVNASTLAVVGRDGGGLQR